MFRIIDSKSGRVVKVYADYQECYTMWYILSNGDANKYDIESYRLFSGRWVNVNDLHRKEY